MRHLSSATLFAAGLMGLLSPGTRAGAANVAVDLTTQRLHVESASGAGYDWPISSAREGYVTPTGAFRPVRLAAVYHSKKYDNAPMPHAVFFYYGYAIHGTNDVRHLGQPASHGCIRLSPENATKLFNMVQAEGGTITITGSPPGQPPINAAVNAGAPQPSPSSGLFSMFAR